jgi:hypothetical protein
MAERRVDIYRGRQTIIIYSMTPAAPCPDVKRQAHHQ